MSNMFSRRHYIFMADTIKRFQFISDEERQAFASILAYKLQADNELFDKQKFMKACSI